MELKMSNKALSATVVATATSGLTLYLEGKKIAASLEEIKHKLVDAADGDTLVVMVPGLGKVTVVKGSEGEATGDVQPVFNAEAFAKLTTQRRNALILDGVVTMTPVVKRAVSAHVRYAPNA
jgi:hypothetical protein